MNQINTELVNELDGNFAELSSILQYKKSAAVKPLEEQINEKREQEAKMTQKELAKQR